MDLEHLAERSVPTTVSRTLQWCSFSKTFARGSLYDSTGACATLLRCATQPQFLVSTPPALRCCSRHYGSFLSLRPHFKAVYNRPLDTHQYYRCTRYQPKQAKQKITVNPASRPRRTASTSSSVLRTHTSGLKTSRQRATARSAAPAPRQQLLKSTQAQIKEGRHGVRTERHSPRSSPEQKTCFKMTPAVQAGMPGPERQRGDDLRAICCGALLESPLFSQ